MLQHRGRGRRRIGGARWPRCRGWIGHGPQVEAITWNRSLRSTTLRLWWDRPAVPAVDAAPASAEVRSDHSEPFNEWPERWGPVEPAAGEPSLDQQDGGRGGWVAMPHARMTCPDRESSTRRQSGTVRLVTPDVPSGRGRTTVLAGKHDSRFNLALVDGGERGSLHGDAVPPVHLPDSCAVNRRIA